MIKLVMFALTETTVVVINPQHVAAIWQNEAGVANIVLSCGLTYAVVETFEQVIAKLGEGNGRMAD